MPPYLQVLSNDVERKAYDQRLPRFRSPSKASPSNAEFGRAWSDARSREPTSGVGRSAYRNERATGNWQSGSDSYQKAHDEALRKNPEHSWDFINATHKSPSASHFRQPRVDPAARARFNKYAAWEAKRRQEQQAPEVARGVESVGEREGSGSSFYQSHQADSQGQNSTGQKSTRDTFVREADADHGENAQNRAKQRFYQSEDPKDSSEDTSFSQGARRSGWEWHRQTFRRGGHFSWSSASAESSPETSSENVRRQEDPWRWPSFTLEEAVKAWGGCFLEAAVPEVVRLREMRRQGTRREGELESRFAHASWGSASARQVYAAQFPPETSADEGVFREHNLETLQHSIAPVLLSLTLVASICVAFPTPVALVALSISLIASQGAPIGMRIAGVCAVIVGGMPGVLIAAIVNILARLPGSRAIDAPVGALTMAITIGPWMWTALKVSPYAASVLALRAVNIKL